MKAIEKVVDRAMPCAAPPVCSEKQKSECRAVIMAEVNKALDKIFAAEREDRIRTLRLISDVQSEIRTVRRMVERLAGPTRRKKS